MERIRVWGGKRGVHLSAVRLLAPCWIVLYSEAWI